MIICIKQLESRTAANLSSPTDNNSDCTLTPNGSNALCAGNIDRGPEMSWQHIQRFLRVCTTKGNTAVGLKKHFTTQSTFHTWLESINLNCSQKSDSLQNQGVFQVYSISFRVPSLWQPEAPLIWSLSCFEFERFCILAPAQACILFCCQTKTNATVPPRDWYELWIQNMLIKHFLR